MALFIVQTPFSRRLTSRSPYLSFSVPYFSVYVFIHISYTYDYVTNTCSPLLSEDHIVGKPIFIWLSLNQDRGWFDGKIRWNRLFKFVDSIK